MLSVTGKSRNSPALFKEDFVKTMLEIDVSGNNLSDVTILKRMLFGKTKIKRLSCFENVNLLKSKEKISKLFEDIGGGNDFFQQSMRIPGRWRVWYGTRRADFLCRVYQETQINLRKSENVSSSGNPGASF